MQGADPTILHVAAILPARRALITVWLQVRVLPGPPMRSSTWRNCRFCCGLFRGPVALFRLSLEAACTDHRSRLWTALLAERWRVSKMRSLTPLPTRLHLIQPDNLLPGDVLLHRPCNPVEFPQNHLKQPAPFAECRKIDSRRSIPSPRSITGTELQSDFLVAIRNPQRRPD